MNIKQDIARSYELAESYIANLSAFRAAADTIEAAFSRVTLDYCYFYPEQNQIICRVQTREDFAPIRALKTGLWEKQIWDDSGKTVARYAATTDCGVNIICYVCELPPSCRLVEERKWIAAHEKVTRRVVCNDPELVGA